MKRRDFIKKSIGAGIALGSAGTLGGINNIFGSQEKKDGPYDLVAVKGDSPEAMFEKGIKALGGMEKFVKKGQKVVVKPNIGWDCVPEKAANTNPGLVKRIIEHCYKAGAEEVFVFDNTCDNWKRCYENSGIEKAVKEAGGNIAPGNSQTYYKDFEIPGAVELKTTQVHELILNADVFINVPILKDHQATRLTIAMKNLMGIVWDRRFWHRNNLHQCIADSCLIRKPDLNIVDAYRVMKRNGPRGVSVDDVLMKHSLLLSTDIVAVDAAAAKLFGLEPEDIEHIKLAHDMKIGTMDLKNLNIARLKA